MTHCVNLLRLVVILSSQTTAPPVLADDPAPSSHPTAADLNAILSLPWPDVEALRIEHRRRVNAHLLDAPDRGRHETFRLSDAIARFDGFIEGAVTASDSYQQWRRDHPDDIFLHPDVWDEPAFPADERDRLTRLVVSSPAWSNLMRAAEAKEFQWPEPVALESVFGTNSVLLDRAGRVLHEHLARTGDLSSFAALSRAMLGTARALDAEGGMLGRIGANALRLRVYESTIGMVRASRGTLTAMQLKHLADTIGSDTGAVPIDLILMGNYTVALDNFLFSYKVFREARPEIEAIVEQGESDTGIAGEFLRGVYENAGLWSEEDAAALPDPRADLKTLQTLDEIFAQIISEDRATSDAGRARYEEFYERIRSDEIFAAQRPVASMTHLSWQNLVDVSALVETTRQATLAVIALERYRLEHAEYPPDLATLVPNYMDAVPYDRDADAPVVYRRTTNDAGQPDYIMYAIGPDRMDNAGASPPKHWSTPAFSRKQREAKTYDVVFTAIKLN